MFNWRTSSTSCRSIPRMFSLCVTWLLYNIRSVTLRFPENNSFLLSSVTNIKFQSKERIVAQKWNTRCQIVSKYSLTKCSGYQNPFSFNVIYFTYSVWSKLCLQKFPFERNFYKWSFSVILSFNTTLKPRAMQNVDSGGQNQEMFLWFLYYDQHVWFRAKLINDLSSQQLLVVSPVFSYISKGS